MVDEKGIGVDERMVEIKMAYYCQNMDTEDLKFFAHNVFSQLKVWRSAIPDDISENEMKSLKEY